MIDSAARASTEENLSQSAARASASDVQTESTARASADPQGHIMTASAFRSSTAHTGGIQLSLDSAADVHLLNTDQAHKLLTDIEPAQLQVHGVSAVPALADEKGLLRLDLTSADGRRFNMNLGTAYILKDLPINIISVALMLEQGAVVHLEKGQCYLQPAPDSPRFPLQERGGQFHLDLGTPGEDADVFCSYSGEAHVFIGAADLSTWHHRLAHREKRDIVEWDRQGILPGLKLQGRQDPTGRCIICQMSKARCSPIYSTRAFEEPALAIGHVVHADLKSMRVTSLQGFRYALVFVDMFSRLTILYFLRSKSETSEMLPELIAEFKRYGHTIRTMYTDRGSEFYSGDGETFQDHHRRIADFTRICDSHGGRHRVAPVEHKAQLSEAAIKVTFDAATTQLWHAYLSPVFWPESAAFANYVRNRLPNNHLGGFVSPMTAFTGQEQRVDHIRVFGCDCVGVIPNNDLRKVAGLPRGRKLLFMGFDRHREGYLCFDPVTRRFVTQKDLYFCENMQGRHSALIQHDRFREMIKDGVDFEDLPLQLDDRRDPDVRSLDTIRGLYMDPEIPFEASPQLLEHDDYHVGGVKPTSQPSDEPELAGREDEVPADPDILRRPCRTTKRGIRVTMTDEDRRFIQAAETDNFAIQFVPNPKTPGGASFDRYDLYKSAGTIGEARTLGASRQDIKWDYQHGFILFPTRESTEPGHVFTAAVEPVHSLFEDVIMEDAEQVAEIVDNDDDTRRAYNVTTAGSQRRKMRSVSTPMVIEGVQPNEGATVTEQQYPFREVLGAVMHCANWVRPDIMVATNMLAKFSGNPGSVHALALDRLLMYCYNTATLGIQFQRPTPALERSLSTALPKIEMYCDASHADTPQRRSRIGFVAMLNGGPISFMATEGKTVDTSTMESELHAAFFAAKECIHLADMLFDLGFTPERQCVKIYEDNSSLITRSNGGIKAVRAIRHVQIRIRFLQEQIQEGRIVFEYIPTQDQIGDAMTKPLPGAQFTKLRDLMLH